MANEIIGHGVGDLHVDEVADGGGAVDEDGAVYFGGVHAGAAYVVIGGIVGDVVYEYFEGFANVLGVEFGRDLGL